MFVCHVRVCCLAMFSFPHMCCIFCLFLWDWPKEVFLSLLLPEINIENITIINSGNRFLPFAKYDSMLQPKSYFLSIKFANSDSMIIYEVEDIKSWVHKVCVYKNFDWKNVWQHKVAPTPKLCQKILVSEISHGDKM